MVLEILVIGLIIWILLNRGEEKGNVTVVDGDDLLYVSETEEVPTSTVGNLEDLETLCSGEFNESVISLPSDFTLVEKVEKAVCCNDANGCTTERPYSIRITEKSIAPTITISGTDTILTENSIDFIGRLSLDVLDVNRDLASIKVDGIMQTFTDTASHTLIIEADDAEHTIVITDELGNVTTSKVFTISHVPSIVELSGEEPVTEVTGDFIFTVLDKKDDIISVTDNEINLQCDDSGFYFIKADDNEHTIEITDSEQNVTSYTLTVSTIKDDIKIFIPKKLVMTTDENGLIFGEFSIDVDGFINDGKAVVIKTDNELLLSQEGKSDVSASVLQVNSVFYGDNFTGSMVTGGKVFTDSEEDDVDCKGSISVQNLGAGS